MMQKLVFYGALVFSTGAQDIYKLNDSADGKVMCKEGKLTKAQCEKAAEVNGYTFQTEYEFAEENTYAPGCYVYVPGSGDYEGNVYFNPSGDKEKMGTAAGRRGICQDCPSGKMLNSKGTSCVAYIELPEKQNRRCGEGHSQEETKVLNTPTECYEKCSSIDGCKYFSYWTNQSSLGLCEDCPYVPDVETNVLAGYTTSVYKMIAPPAGNDVTVIDCSDFHSAELCKNQDHCEPVMEAPDTQTEETNNANVGGESDDSAEKFDKCVPKEEEEGGGGSNSAGPCPCLA